MIVFHLNFTIECRHPDVNRNGKNRYVTLELRRSANKEIIILRFDCHVDNFIGWAYTYNIFDR